MRRFPFRPAPARHPRSSPELRALLLLAVAGVAACGGGTSGGDSFTLGGTVAGLTSSGRFGPLVLQNGASDSVSVAASGAFSFSKRVREGSLYAVTVSAQPSIQTCTVANGTGTATAAVTNVAVTCVTNAAFTLGGAVSGLSGTLVLNDSSMAQDLTVGANGAFAFATPVPGGAPYTVAVKSQPAGQICTVENGVGTMASANVSNVVVTCAGLPAGLLSIGGTVSGLTGGSMELALQGSAGWGSSISVATNGAFDFDPDGVFAGDPYFVEIIRQPAGQRCSLTNGVGIALGDVTALEVICVAAATRYSVGGVITGLRGAGLRIEDGANNRASPGRSDTTFELPVTFANGSVYDVGISAQPAGQTCLITGANGVVAAADVTNLLVTCIDNVTDPLAGTYSAQFAPSFLMYLTLFPDGVYILGGMWDTAPCVNGVEYGVYDYDAAAGTFTVKSAVVDTNGPCGLWDGSEYVLGAYVTGSGQTKTLSLDWFADFVPVASSTGQLHGSFTDLYRKSVWLFLDTGAGNVHFFNAETRWPEPGIELACGAINGTAARGTLNRDFSSFCQAPAPGGNGPVDTNGPGGLSGFFGSWEFDVSGDALDTSSFDGTRAIPN